MTLLFFIIGLIIGALLVGFVLKSKNSSLQTQIGLMKEQEAKNDELRNKQFEIQINALKSELQNATDKLLKQREESLVKNNSVHIEAVLALGDRRLSKSLLLAHERGFGFDAWDEYFDAEAWMKVFADSGIDTAFYANRRRADDEVLPWDIIDVGVTKEFLLREKKKAYDEKTTPSCREQCSGCGANCLGGKDTCCPNSKK